jgi:hypothetical protein
MKKRISVAIYAVEWLGGRVIKCLLAHEVFLNKGVLALFVAVITK